MIAAAAPLYGRRPDLRKQAEDYELQLPEQSIKKSGALCAGGN
jgi:hypothetical protein